MEQLTGLLQPSQQNIQPLQQGQMEESALPQKEQTQTPQQGQVNKQLTMFMVNGLKVLSDPKYVKEILTVLKSGVRDLLQAISDVMVGIIIAMVTDAKERGVVLDNGVLAHGTNLLLGYFFQMLEAAGMEPLTDEEKTSVYQMTVAQYLDQAIKAGLMTKEELLQVSEQMKQTPQGQKVMRQKDLQTPVQNQAPTKQQAQLQPSQGLLKEESIQ